MSDLLGHATTIPAPRSRGADRRRQEPTAQAVDLLIQEPLFLKDGALHLHLCGHDLPLMNAGQPVTAFQPGWRARALFTGFAPLLLLELVHDTGEEATWFLDYRMQRVAGTIDQLPPDLLELLTHKATALLLALMHQVLEATMPALDAALGGFLGLNEPVRHAIAQLCHKSVVRRPAVYLVRDLMPHSLVYRGQDGVLRTIDQALLAASLAEDWQRRIPGFVRSGTLSWPSPVDGRALMAQGTLPLDDFHYAYRIVDHRNALSFFALVGNHRAVVLGLWFPAQGLLVAQDEKAGHLAGSVLNNIQWWFTSLSVMRGGEMIPYLARGATRFASVMRGPPGAHIGHQLWNELSGIERMVREHPDALPDWLVLDAARGTEFYGPIDELFDALRGRVDRSVGGYAELVRRCFAERLFLLRVTDDLVTESLRDRLLARVAASSEARRVAASLPVPRGLVLMVGLRVENRTLVELGEFLTHLVAFVAGTHPGATIVFDGHNVSATDGGAIASHGERHDGPSMTGIERALVDALRQAFQGVAVTIRDTIGEPLANSLAWSAASDAFVSIWGASLAKYRWVCNKPGYILSGRMNLLHRGDLHIYDSPRYVERPSPVRFANPDLVTDHPDAPQLVPVAPGNWALYNFDVDRAGILAEIGETIDAVLAGRAVA